MPWWRDHPWLGRHLYVENRNKNLELLERLLQYEGKWVAWYPDGSGIRGVHQDLQTLRLEFEEIGEDPEWYHYEYIDNIARI